MIPIALKMYIQLFVISIPPMLVCLAACVIILCSWKSGRSWQLWALLGFGLGLIISVAIPITQASVQSWVVEGGNISSRAWIFSVLGGFWSFLHACVYGLLLVAVLEGRK